MEIKDKTPVTLLQELLMKKTIVPHYALVLNGVGSHEPTFKFEVTACGKTALGTGKSKKEAKHEAARLLLLKLETQGSELEDLDIMKDEFQSPYAGGLKENAVGALQDFCIAHQAKLPKYDLIRDEGLAHSKRFCMRCSVSSLITDGEARSKKQAKHIAAQRMLKLLKKCSEIEVSDIFANNEITFDESNRNAVNKLYKIKYYIEENEHQVSPLEVNYSEYQNIFYKSEALNPSKTLRSFRNKRDEWFETHDAAGINSLFESVLKELNLTYDLELLPVRTPNVVIVCITVKSTPSWVLMGSGGDVSVAKKKAQIETLKFFRTMIKPRIVCYE